MKIVYICNEINLNSGWAVLNYYTIINASNCFSEVIVFTLSNAKNIDVLKYNNITVIPILNSMSDSFLKYPLVILDLIRIRKNVDINKIDIVHILVEPLLPLVSIFKNSQKIFGIVGTYSIITFKHGINRFLYKKSLKNIDKIVSISEYTKNNFTNIYNHNIEVIPLGVSYQKFQYNLSKIQKEKAFVFVGHIKPRKGLIYALKAFKKITYKYSNIKFYIVGAKIEGQYADNCMKYIESKNLLQSVILVGKVSDVELIKIYQSSICNILTSVNVGEHFEGFGLIHLEANACGIPSIGSKNCGNESAIIHGMNGYLCNQKNVEDIATKMEFIIQDYENNDFDKWTKNCKQYAKNNDWKIYFNTLKEKVYEI